MISINIEKKLKAYHGQQVLHIDKQFATGSVTKIHGPSGSGKTTFLKVIAGLISPEKGIIKVDNETWFNSEAKVSLSTQKRNIGFVFQQYALFPNMTVRQHLEYATGDEKWINKLLLLGKLESLQTHKPDYLSGGQQQRLAILRALATKPRLLLMDEPFSALDAKMKTELMAELKTLSKELKITTIIVSHNPQELDGWADEEIVFS
ncbi:ATP-binding cassette domain-containing protein [Mucilaginibacter ginsenosidivorax]|uniref:ATP-binding cassette domain-containing protein n=1 Tax=Mucilaginibacter ginsenosidivorax TaxID=862126 RepID=A0A5B8W178_9SPHI|nr:ATP-binding cassette domain-containing protein [Mucilaginibacter ginsenosidivorax]QEC77443.1 ATP-binding cassette domain-containing protein [Mucilaginibacter ginsenosidivorax]